MAEKKRKRGEGDASKENGAEVVFEIERSVIEMQKGLIRLRNQANKKGKNQVWLLKK